MGTDRWLMNIDKFSLLLGVYQTPLLSSGHVIYENIYCLLFPILFWLIYFLSEQMYHNNYSIPSPKKILFLPQKKKKKIILFSATTKWFPENGQAIECPFASPHLFYAVESTIESKTHDLHCRKDVWTKWHNRIDFELKKTCCHMLAWLKNEQAKNLSWIFFLHIFIFVSFSI